MCREYSTVSKQPANRIGPDNNGTPPTSFQRTKIPITMSPVGKPVSCPIFWNYLGRIALLVRDRHLTVHFMIAAGADLDVISSSWCMFGHQNSPIFSGSWGQVYDNLRLEAPFKWQVFTALQYRGLPIWDNHNNQTPLFLLEALHGIKTKENLHEDMPLSPNSSRCRSRATPEGRGVELKTGLPFSRGPSLVSGGQIRSGRLGDGLQQFFSKAFKTRSIYGKYGKELLAIYPAVVNFWHLAMIKLCTDQSSLIAAFNEASGKSTEG